MPESKQRFPPSGTKANLAWLAAVLVFIASVIPAAAFARTGAAGGAASGFAYSAGIGEGALQVAESTGENALFGGVTGGIFGAGVGLAPYAGQALVDAGAASQQYASLFARGFMEAPGGGVYLGSGLGGAQDAFERTAAGLRAMLARVNPGEMDTGFQSIVSEQFPNGEKQLAVSKGFPGIGFTADGVPDFAGTPYLYPVTEGQLNIVTIKLTGSRTADFEAANAGGGFSETPAGYTWHHLGYEPTTGEGELQLISQAAHKATYPHFGGVSLYENSNGVGYDP